MTCARPSGFGAWPARGLSRGEEYALDGRVERLTVAEDSATATVIGAAPYRVGLRRDRAGALTGSCTCPIGEEGAFCKHCVAVGLAVAGNAAPPYEELRAYVASRAHAELVELVCGALERDRVLRDSLQLEMAAAAGDGEEALAVAIDEAAFVAYELRWDQVCEYAERLDAVLDALERRLARGHAAEVVVLAERFATAVAAQLEYVDDSLGAVGSAIERAQVSHLAACRQGAPDGVALAERLFELETSTDLFDEALDTHADALGKAGRARYAELADAAWAAGLPSWQLKRIMERLAAGDVDRLVAIKARTSSTAGTTWRLRRCCAMPVGSRTPSVGRSAAASRRQTPGCVSSWPTACALRAGRRLRSLSGPRSSASSRRWRPTGRYASRPSRSAPVARARSGAGRARAAAARHLVARSVCARGDPAVGGRRRPRVGGGARGRLLARALARAGPRASRRRGRRLPPAAVGND